MRFCAQAFFGSAVLILALITFAVAQEPGFHNAPASAAELKNPYQEKPEAAAAGKRLYKQNCAQCHGNNRQGMGPAPALDGDDVHNAKPGQLFWFITNGDASEGMPSWSNLPKTQRWQLVTFLQQPNGKTDAR